MTTANVTMPARARDVLACEWIKLRSVRSSYLILLFARAISAMAAVVFLLPQIVHALPAPWDVRIGKYTLDLAAQQAIAQHPAAGYLPAGPSFLIVAAYAAVAIAAAAFVITRRDA